MEFDPEVEEHVIPNRCLEFQSTNRFQKRKLHEHVIQRKRCWLLSHQDIIDAYWNVYEQEAFNRLNELISDYDLSVTNEQTDRCVFDALLSLNKNEISYGVKNVCSFSLK